MGLFSKLFGKKKAEDKTAKIEETKPKAESPKAESAPVAKAAPKTEAAPVKQETPTQTVDEAKTTTAAKETAPKKTAESKTVNAPKTEAPKAEAPKAEAPTAEEVKNSGYFSKVGRFEIKRSKDDRYVFNLYAPNRVIVATSQVYSSAQSAITGIKSVMANAERAPIEDQTLKTYETLSYPKWEIYQDKGGQYRFRLLAPNGSCICHSQGYTTKASCKNGIESIAKNAKTSTIDKAYLK